MDNLIQFEQSKIRKTWHNEQWYFSVVDIVQALTQQNNYQTARKYWNKLKERLNKEWNESVTNCHQLKLSAEDWKMRETDVANVETLLRIIQSVPSPKAEPIKLWLAKVWTERIAEIQDPSQWVDRARDLWKKHWRSEKWIQQRMMWQETRNKLTDYWKEHDVKEKDEYAILTNIIHQEWADMGVKQHKELKNLKTSNNLRDHMNEAELILTALAELSTRQIAESMNAKWLEQNKIPAKKWWQIAKNARKELESKTWKKVVTWENFLPTKKQIKSIKK